MSQRLKQRLISGLLLLLALALMWGLLRYLGWYELRQLWQQLGLVPLLLLMLLQLATMLLTAKVWHLWLCRHEQPPRFYWVALSQLVGYWAEAITPSSKLGGEASRILLLKQRSQLSYAQLSSSLLAAKLSSLLPFVLLMLGLMLLGLGRWSLPWWLYPILLLMMLVLGLAFLLLAKASKAAKTAPAPQPARRWTAIPIPQPARRWTAWLTPIQRMLQQTHEHWRQGWPWPELLLNALVWLAYPLKVICLASLLGLPSPWLLLALAVMVAYLVSMLPLLPGGIGSFELSMAMVLVLGPLSLEQALLLALFTRLVTFWLPLLLSLAASLLWLLQLGPARASAPYEESCDAPH